MILSHADQNSPTLTFCFLFNKNVLIKFSGRPLIPYENNFSNMISCEQVSNALDMSQSIKDEHRPLLEFSLILPMISNKHPKVFFPSTNPN